MISFEEAYACVLRHALKSETIKVSPLFAKGSILKEDLRTSRPFPPFDRVAMDGIAIGSLKSNRFKSEGVQHAGEMQKRLRKKKNCIEVMTGAVLPKGTQAVIRNEDLEKTGDLFILKPEVKPVPYKDIHRKGADAQINDLLLREGTYLTPAHIAIIASLGKKEILVGKTPKVSILSTGDELISNLSKPKPYQIFSSNAEAIFTAIGFPAKMLHTEDSPSSILSGIEQGLADSELLIISGGISLGKKDFVPKALKKAKVEKLIHGVQQNPGKPFWFGRSNRGQLVFGLPGNPAAMLISLYLYVLPLLGRIQKSWAILGKDIEKFSSKYARFILVTISQGQAEPVQNNGSGDLVALARADGFVMPSTGKKGEVVRLWLW